MAGRMLPLRPCCTARCARPRAWSEKNARSISVAGEHHDKVYQTSGHRAATNGILKGISVWHWLCGRPREAAQHARGDGTQGFRATRGPLGANEGQACPGAAEASPALPRQPSHRRSNGHDDRRAQGAVQEDGHNGRDDGVDAHRRPRGGVAANGHMDNDKKKGGGGAAGMLCCVCSLFVPPDAPLQLLPAVLRVRRVILVPEVVLRDVPLGAKSLFHVISFQIASDFGDTGSTTQLRPPPPLDAPLLGYSHPSRPFRHHHRHRFKLKCLTTHETCGVTSPSRHKVTCGVECRHVAIVPPPLPYKLPTARERENPSKAVVGRRAKKKLLECPFLIKDFN